MVTLSITPEMVLELFDMEVDVDDEEKPGLYVSRDGWTVGMTPADLPDGLPTSLAGTRRTGEVLHGGPMDISREDALAKFTRGAYTIPFEDGTEREPAEGEIPEIAFPNGAKSIAPGMCWWFDAAKATLMAAEHEDVGDPRYSIWRTAAGRYVEREHIDDPDDAWILPFRVTKALTPIEAAQQLFDQYPHLSDDTDPETMSGLLACALELGRMVSSYPVARVRVPEVEKDLRDGADRIAHARQQFADAGDLAVLVRDTLLPAIRTIRVDALRDLLRELMDQRPATAAELLPEAAALLQVSPRTLEEMYRHG